MANVLKPTALQLKTFGIVQTQKKKNVKKAMIEAGYSPSSANVSQKLTKSENWLRLSGKELSDEFLLKRHKYLIKKNDGASIARGLDMAYRLKKYYGEDANHGGNIQVQIINYSKKLAEENETVKQIAEVVQVGQAIENGTMVPVQSDDEVVQGNDLDLRDVNDHTSDDERAPSVGSDEVL